MKEILQFKIEHNNTVESIFQEIILNHAERNRLAFFIKMLNRDEGGSPIIEDLRINNIHINPSLTNGFVEISYTINYYWACADKELTEALVSTFDFSINKNTATLQIIGPETNDRDMNGF